MPAGPEGLLDGKAPGPRSRLNDAQRQALVDVVESGPVPAIHDEFAVSLDETTVSRELKKLGYPTGPLCHRPTQTSLRSH